MPIDALFRIFAVNTTIGNIHTQEDGFFMQAYSYGVLPMLHGYKIGCQNLGCGKEHIESIDLLIEKITLFQKGIIPRGIILIDRKYRVLAVSVKTGHIADEKEGMLFSAADKAVLSAMQVIKFDRDKKWTAHDWRGVEGLTSRVEIFQLTQRSKIPDANLGRDIRQCAAGFDFGD